MRMMTCLMGDSVLSARTGSLLLPSAATPTVAASENDNVALVKAAPSPHLLCFRSVFRIFASPCVWLVTTPAKGSEQISQYGEAKMSVTPPTHGINNTHQRDAALVAAARRSSD